MGWKEGADGLRAAGIPDSEIQGLAGGLADHMASNGYSDLEIADYFGKPPEPDPSALTEHFNQQFKRNMPTGETPATAPDNDTYATAIKAAWQGSVLGLGVRHGVPDTELEKPSIFFEGAGAGKRIAQGAVQGALDLPWMIAGGIAGAPLGPAGSSAAAFALPQAMRDALVKGYEQGGIHSAHDFTQMADAAFIGAVKGGITGLATAGAGSAVKALGTDGLLNTFNTVVAESITMPTVSSALEGKLPELSDFADAAAQIGGMHGFGLAKSKALAAFKDTGLHPHDLAAVAMNNPVVQQELMSQSKETPPSLRPLMQPEIKSDFVIEDGKLVPADKASPQSGFNFEKTTLSKMVEDHQERTTMAERERAARAHDPEAFKAMEKMSSELREGQKRIADNEEAMASFRESEAKKAELTDVQNNLNNPKTTKEEFYRLAEREHELLAEKDKIEKEASRAQSLRNENAQISSRLERIKNNSTIKERLTNAWKKGGDTLEANLKDRIRNKVIQIQNDPMAEHFPGINPDFSDKENDVPEITPEGRIQLMDPDQLHLFYGDEGRYNTRDEVMAQLLKEHPELAKAIAPEVVNEVKTTDESGKVKSTLQVGPRAPKAREPVSVSNFAKNYFDNLYYLELAQREVEARTGEKVPLSASPMAQMLKSRASRKLMANFVGKAGEKEGSGFGVYDKYGNKLSDSWTKIHEDGGITKENADDFRRFRIYKHAIDENARGQTINPESGLPEITDKKSGAKLTGVNDAEARAFVAAHEAKFGATAKKLTDWNNSLLRFAESHGLLTKEFVDFQIKDKPNYVSFSRLTDDMKSKGSATNKKYIVYSREGSELPFVDPAATDLEKVYNITKRVAENSAVKAAVELDKLGGNNLIEKIGQPDGERTAVDINDNPTFRADEKNKDNLPANQVGYYDNGKFKVVQFKDAELAKALQAVGFEPGVMNPIKFFGRAAAKITLNATSSGYDFIVRHVFRDELNTAIVNKDLRVPFINTIRNLGEAFSKTSDVYAEAQRAGAFDNVMSQIDGILNDKTYGMNDKEGGWSRAVNVIKTPWQLSHSLMQLMAEAKSLSIYKDKISKLPENATWADLEAAGFSTTESSINGLRIGAKFQGAMSYMAFMHYETQGTYGAFRSIRDNPGAVAMKGALLTSAAMYLWHANKDDPDYKKIPEWEKNAFLHVKVNGTYMKLPTPWALGALFCAVPARLADTIVGHDPKAAAGLAKTIGGFVPFFNPMDWRASIDRVSGIGMIDQYLMNHNPITGKNIVQDKLKNLVPEAQVQPYNSNLALGVSKLMYGVWGSHQILADSPQMIDHMVQNFSGQPGQLILRAIETSLSKAGVPLPQERPPMELIDIPFVGGLISREPTYSAQPLVDLNEEYQRVKGLHDSYVALYKANNPDAAQKLLEEHPEINDFRGLQNAKKALSIQNKMIQGINLDPNQSPSDKKQTTEPMWRIMVGTAQQKLEELKESRENQ